MTRSLLADALDREQNAKAKTKLAEHALEQTLAHAEQMGKSPSRLVRKAADELRATIAAAYGRKP